MNDVYLIAHIGHTSKSCEHITWWNPDSRGYTYCIDKAGKYSAKQAEEICRSGLCAAFRFEDVEPIAHSTPYYRRSDGRLDRLYDGEKQRVIPNSAKCWRILMFAKFPMLSKTIEREPVAVLAEPKHSYARCAGDLA